MSKKSRKWLLSDESRPTGAKEQLIQRLMTAFSNELKERRPIPKLGDHIQAVFNVSGGRYTIEADCVPDPGILKYDPAKGKPFVLALSIFGPDGERLK